MLKKLFKFLWRLVSWVYKAVTYCVATVFMLLGILLVAIVMYATILRTELITGQNKEIKEDSFYLYLNLETVSESSVIDPPYFHLAHNLGINIPKVTSIGDLKDILEVAKQDKRVKGIFVDTDKSNYETTALAQELGEALQQYKKATGNPIYGYSVHYGLEDFLVMQATDRRFVPNAGGLVNDIYNVNSFFLEDFYKSYGVKDYSYKVGKYALSNLMSQNGWTEDNQYNLTTLTYDKTNLLLDDLNKFYGANLKTKDFELDNFIALGRQFKNETYLLKESKLVTDVGTPFQWGDFVRSKAGVNKETKRPFIVPYSAYIEDMLARDALPYDETKDYYKVYYYSGVLDPSDVSAKDILSDLKEDTVYFDAEQVDKDDKSSGRHTGRLKGIVLRLNSPGGSVTEAQVLNEGLKEISKYVPVVVSVSDVLTGATYAGVQNADAIVASSLSTIGAVETHYQFTDVTDTLRAFYNINPSYFKSSKLLALNSSVPFPFDLVLKTSKVVLVNQEYLDMRNLFAQDQYNYMVSAIAQGRGLDVAKVDELSQGKAYNAKQAKDLHFVDDIGGVEVAYAQLDNLNKKRDAKFDASTIVKYEANPNPSKYNSILGTLNSVLNSKLAFDYRIENNLSYNQFKVQSYELKNGGEILSLCTACMNGPSSLNLAPSKDAKNTTNMFMDVFFRK